MYSMTFFFVINVIEESFYELAFFLFLCIHAKKMNSNSLPQNNFEDFDSISDALHDCDIIKYAAYRTAAKLRLLQKAFYTDKLPLRIISNIYDRHHLHQTENSVHLDEKELDPVLHDIYFFVQKEYYCDINIDHAVNLIKKYLFNVYDKKRNNSIQVLCSKIGLTILCSGKPREKYQYLFNQLADHNSCLSKKKLEVLLKRILDITTYVNEDLYFRTDLIPGTVESCFQYNSGTLGVSEDDFISWLVQDPQILVWISTLYRMQLSETVCHTAKCAVCRIYPIIGLRYRCLRCLSYNQCQSCFFTGKFNKKHKLTHPVQEYCFQVTSRQSTKAFLLTIKNRLLKSHSKLQYLPAEKVNTNHNDSLGDSTRLLDEIEVSSRTVVNGSRITLQNQPQKELHSIILHLEKESEKIIPQIEQLCSMKDLDRTECHSQLKKCLLDHKDQVKQQVQRLKLLKDYLVNDQRSKLLFESTPVVESTNGKIRISGVNKELEGISPIARKKNSNKERNLFLKKMMWDKYDIVNGTVNTSWEEFPGSQFESDLQDVPITITDTAKMSNTTNENELNLSTLMGGSTLKELDYSSNRGFTRWLDSDSEGNMNNNPMINGEVHDVNGLRLQNEKYLHDIEYDLEDILNKLEELTSNTKEKENIAKSGKSDEDVMSDIDGLLVGLINGIDKLISN